MPTESTAAVTGETPAAGQEPVQPPAPAPKPPTVAPAAPAEQASDDDEGPYDRERAMATIRRQRAELKVATAANKELATLKAAQQAIDDAKLSEQEKLTKRAAQLEAELAFERQEKQDRINHYEVQIAAGKLGIVDPDAAVKLLDWAALEYDTEGRPKDIDKALKVLVRERPYLAGTPSTPQVSATNGATRAQAPGSRLYSKAELNDYGFYERHRDDIVLAMREGRIID